MSYTILPITNQRKVTLCGTNVYPVPEPHLDRVLSEHDLLYIFSGEQAIAQDDETFTLQTGDLILLRAGSHHYGTAPCSVNMRSIFIHFNALPGDRGEKFITQEELDKSFSQLKGSLYMGLETVNSRMNKLGRSMLIFPAEHILRQRFYVFHGYFR